MSFDDLVFETVTGRGRTGLPYVKLRKHGNGVAIYLNCDTRNILNVLRDKFNGIELLVSGRDVFAIKPIIKNNSKSTNQSTFTLTGIVNRIDNLPVGEKIFVVMWNDMIVCDLRKSAVNKG
jgi:hypothetical protein